MSGILLLLSGGIDSALCLHEHDISLAVGFDYGQPNFIELDHAARLAANRGVLFEVVYTNDLPLIQGSLVRAGRNAVMLSLAAAIAQVRGLETVMIGCNATDAERFPDCRPEFIERMNHALCAAYGVSVCAPLLGLTKREIITRCKEHEITDTWSCYTPINQKPCGECYSCKSRLL